MPSAQLLSVSFLALSIALLLHNAAGSEIRIHNPSELIDFSNSVNSGTNYSGTTVFLDSDIDFNGFSSEFNPIGKSDSKYFLGTFDGQGHKIGNITLDFTSTYNGLFGYSRGLTIRNVVIDDSCSSTKTFITQSNKDYMGGIIGYCTADKGPCVIENIVSMASAIYDKIYSSGIYNYGALYLGGIIGYFHSSSNYDSIVKNCANYGAITYTGKRSGSYIGGIAGYCSGYSSSHRVLVQNCLSHGSITHDGSTVSSLYIGGIVGKAPNTTFENCVSAGEIVSSKSSDFIGAIAGYVSSESESVRITHSFWTSDVGYNKSCGSDDPISDNETSQVELDTAFANKLNEYTAKNSSWSRWLLNTNNASVSFKINSHERFAFKSQIILLPDTADNSERTFSGWYEDELLITPFALSELEPSTASATLYGMFCGDKYTVSLDVNGGDASSIPELHRMIIECNGVYGALPTPKWEGHRFFGWFTMVDGGEEVRGGDRVTDFRNHTLYAHWLVNQYNLTIDFNNGDENEERILDFNSSLNLPQGITREGYTFAGWDKDIEFMPAEDLTITAQWTANKYTVTFNANGGDVSPNSKEVTYDSSYGDLPEPSRSGHAFLGWLNEKNESVTKETIVTTASNHTLYAQWEEAPTNQVEIVFETKDLTEERIREIIEEYTDAGDFTIHKIESDGLEETRIIIKFTDTEHAKNFVENIKGSSEIKKVIKKVSFISEQIKSFSSTSCPNLLFISLSIF